jgi:hypothetical protein
MGTALGGFYYLGVVYSIPNPCQPWFRMDPGILVPAPDMATS